MEGFLILFKAATGKLEAVGGDCVNVVLQVKGVFSSWTEDETMDDVTSDALTSLVVEGASVGGVVEGQAREFGGEARDGTRGGWAAKEGWEEHRSNCVFNVGEAVRGALENALDKLPFHLE